MAVPAYEDYAELRNEKSPNLGVLDFGFDLLGPDVSDVAVSGLRCLYGTSTPYEGRILAMAVLADNDEAVTFNSLVLPRPTGHRWGLARQDPGDQPVPL